MLTSSEKKLTAYNGSWSVAAWSGAPAFKAISETENTAGLIVKKSSMALYHSGDLSRKMTMIAKSTAPTSNNDGDVLGVSVPVAILTGGYLLMNFQIDGEILVPAGKAIWLYDGYYNQSSWVGGGLYTKL